MVEWRYRFSYISLKNVILYHYLLFRKGLPFTPMLTNTIWYSPLPHFSHESDIPVLDSQPALLLADWPASVAAATPLHATPTSSSPPCRCYHSSWRRYIIENVRFCIYSKSKTWATLCFWYSLQYGLRVRGAELHLMCSDNTQQLHTDSYLHRRGKIKICVLGGMAGCSQAIHLVG